MCLERGLRCAVAAAIENGADSLEVLLLPEAIYVVHFAEERTVTLAEEIASRDGDALTLLDELVQRLLEKDMSFYPDLPSLPPLAPALDGWSIRLVTADGEHELRAGDAGRRRGVGDLRRRRQ